VTLATSLASALDADHALVLGNGVNRYRNTNDDRSWRALLEHLAADSRALNGHGVRDLLDSGGISYQEFFEMLIVRRLDQRVPSAPPLKVQVADILRDWKPGDHHQAVVRRYWQSRRPIITTNFDTLLEQSLVRSIASFKAPKSAEVATPRFFNNFGTRFSRHYPVDAYFSTEPVTNPAQEFAIWHVHGTERYPDSIRLSLSDYMNFVSKMRDWLHVEPGNPFGHGASPEAPWRGDQTWLSILMHQPLVVVGLSLGTSEVGLRWLFVQRAALHRMSGQKVPRLVFVQSHEDTVDSTRLGQDAFIRMIGGETITVGTHDEIYNVLTG
jgi:hypothetical protein